MRIWWYRNCPVFYSLSIHILMPMLSMIDGIACAIWSAFSYLCMLQINQPNFCPSCHYFSAYCLHNYSICSIFISASNRCSLKISAFSVSVCVSIINLFLEIYQCTDWSSRVRMAFNNGGWFWLVLVFGRMRSYKLATVLNKHQPNWIQSFWRIYPDNIGIWYSIFCHSKISLKCGRNTKAVGSDK